MRSGRRAGLLCCCLLGGEAWSMQARGDDPSAVPQVGEVSKQSPRNGLEYCQQLAARVESAAQQRPEKGGDVADLIREGEAQCAAGHIKSGLHRLRIALAIVAQQ